MLEHHDVMKMVGVGFVVVAALLNHAGLGSLGLLMAANELLFA